MGIPGASIAGKIPGIGTITSLVGIRAWVIELRAFGISRYTDGLAAEARALKGLMKETGFKEWARFWHYGRTTIPLTKRLFAEQVFSDLGKPWSQLVTGFGPIRGIIDTAEIRRIKKQHGAAFTGFKRKKIIQKKNRYQGRGR